MKYFFCVNRNAYGLFVNSICKCMKIIKILHSICFSNICLILRVAITASSFFCIARDRCLKGQSDYLLTLCLYSGGEYFGSTSQYLSLFIGCPQWKVWLIQLQSLLSSRWESQFYFFKTFLMIIHRDCFCLKN